MKRGVSIQGCRVRGSFTVEASMLIPLITFVMIAFLGLILYSHDQTVLQTCGWCMAERRVTELFMKDRGRGADLPSAQEISQEVSGRLILTHGRLESTGSSAFSVLKLYRSLTSRLGAEVSAEGEGRIYGGLSLAGQQLHTDSTCILYRTDYADDWFKEKLHH